MKTRIVYPQLWLDEKFAGTKQATKLLFMYLISNQYLGLSRYSRISDRKILFDTGLNNVQINEGKRELEELRWCFFKDEYVFHSHDCAYVDYFRNEKVGKAKEKEVNSIKPEIVRYFDEVYLNNVQTEFKHKSKTINPKPKTINQKQETRKIKIKELNDSHFQPIADKFDVPLSFVRSKHDDMVDWHESTGKVRKDWLATLRGFVKRDSIKIRKEKSSNDKRTNKQQALDFSDI